MVKYITIVAFLFAFFNVSGQPIYDMANAMVNDCEGVLQDSNDGPDGNQYDHNEDYTFIICVPDADEIILNFEFFATEPTYDVLTIYEGNGRGGNVVATLNGVLQPAPSFTVRNECVTFHFVSDDNILANGWRMSWEVIVDEPKTPEMTVLGTLDCPQKDVTVQLDCPVDCDLLTAGSFSIFGPGGPTIDVVTPLNCDPATNTATEFIVEFTDSLRLSGVYRLNFEGRVQDACGEWHDIGSTVLFELQGCPIVPIITELEKACAGDCGRLEVMVVGGGGGNYEYTWSHTADRTPVVEVCSKDSILVTVTVRDLNSLIDYSAQYWYVPIPNPRLLNKLGPDTLCSNRGDHTYQVDITGGRAYSRIIPTWEQERRRYQFWRWNSNPNLIERDIVEYVDTNGCVDRDTFWIHPINIGTDQAACVGSGPFSMNGGTPQTGFWTGDHVTMDGTFDPSVLGSYTITFHAPNGCTASKTVTVTDSIELPDRDTICGGGNVDLRDLVTPYGGQWSGPQITSAIRGRIRADRLTPNQTYRYYYDLVGCRDSIDIFVEEISAGSNRDVCSGVDSLYMTSTGTWSGSGVYDTVRNAFYIGDLGPGSYRYTLSKNGCTDRFWLDIIEVDIRPTETLKFCQDDIWVDVEDYVEYAPGNGTVFSSILKDTLGGLFFNPSTMAPGDHAIYFEALNCTDSVIVTIEGPAEIADYVFCELDDAQTLEAIPPGGTWSGNGILDPQNGLFDPQIVGRGKHAVVYTSPDGCVTIDSIDIIEFEEADVRGIENVYCFQDTIVDFVFSPPGGTLTINGNVSMPQFNPSVLGPGSHEVLYTSGSGDCESSKRLFFTVLFPIEGRAVASEDSICLGENVVISIQPTGGRGILEPTWNQGLGFGNSHIIFPESSDYYTVVVTDGCSDDLIDSVEVYVYPEFNVDVAQGPEVCFEEETYAEIQPPNDGNYRIVWEDGSRDPRLYGSPGVYDALIIQENSGCELEIEVVLPGAPPIKANFNTIPNGGCIDIIDNELRIIDLATGYTEGTMDFGDTSGVLDLLFDELVHYYNTAGEFTITQIVTNELGCTDTLQKVVCVESRTEVYIPNAFTPNDDDENDVLKLNLLGVDRAEWKIFDRFGEIVFSSNDKDATWDGTMDGQRLHNGVYILYLEYYKDGSDFPLRHTQSVTLLR